MYIYIYIIPGITYRNAPTSRNVQLGRFTLIQAEALSPQTQQRRHTVQELMGNLGKSIEILEGFIKQCVNIVSYVSWI